MSKLEQINQVLGSMEDLPEFFQQIQNDVVKYSERLYYLLYAKNDKYEGPLYNGLQDNEWPMITLLVANWLVEVIHKVKPSAYKQNMDKMFYEYNITQVASKILSSLIKSNIIPVSEEKQGITLAILENPQVLNFVNNQLEIIINKFQSGCCGISPSHKTIIQITNETGTRCTFANSIKSLQLRKNIFEI